MTHESAVVGGTMKPEELCMGCMGARGPTPACTQCGWLHGRPPETAQQLRPGTVLENRYVLGRALGQGGFGITYLGYDIDLDRKLAIKEYFPMQVASRSMDRSTVSPYTGAMEQEFEYGLSKFLDEARALAKFQDHPGVVDVLAFFRQNKTAYFVMNYVDGVTFGKYLDQRGGKIPFEEAARILSPAMDALREVHEAGLLHRDISPDNIYLTKSGQVKLLDFGAARMAMGERSKSLSVILKPGYAPFEQYHSRGDQGPWTDVYALAATLYRALTGQIPAESPERMERDDVRPPSHLGAVLPPHAEEAIMIALAVRAKDRFQSMASFQNALLHMGARPAAVPVTAPVMAAGRPISGMASGAVAVTQPVSAPVSRSQPQPWSQQPRYTPPPVSAPPQPPAPRRGSAFKAIAVLVGGMVLAVAAFLGYELLRPVPEPSIGAFAASSTTIHAGENTQLSWSVANAEKVSIDPDVGGVEAQGRRIVTPRDTTTFVLTATPSRGNPVTRSLTVVVLPKQPQRPSAAPVEITAFEADPPVVAPGGIVRLRWSTRGATRVFIDPAVGEAPASSSAQITIRATTRFTITAHGPDGSRATGTTTVVAERASIPPPPKPPEPVSAEFAARPQTVTAGQPVTLLWKTEGMKAVAISPGVGRVIPSGYIQVTPAVSTTYQLMAMTNDGRTISREVEVTVVERRRPVEQPRIIGFRVYPPAIRPGQAARLQWSVSGVRSVSLEPGGGVQPPQGVLQVSPDQTTDFVLTANGEDGTRVSANVTLQVVPATGIGGLGTATVIYVVHDHSTVVDRLGTNQYQTGFCQGQITIQGRTVSFRSPQSNHGFQSTVDQLAEVKVNRMLSRGQSAFHIKLGSGENFNFIPQRISAREAVGLIQNAR